MEYFTMTFEDSSEVTLANPYFGGNMIGPLDMNFSNMQFKSGNYKSYVNSIAEETFTITGCDYDDALSKLMTISDQADDGSQVIISVMDDTWNDTYIIESISYSVIGKKDGEDVWEYSITFSKAEDSAPS